MTVRRLCRVVLSWASLLAYSFDEMFAILGLIVRSPADASLKSISRVGLIVGLRDGEIVTGLHCDLTLNGLLEFFLKLFGSF